MIIRKAFVFLSTVFCLTGTVHANLEEGSPQVLRGELPPFSYPDLERNFGKIWDFSLKNSDVSMLIRPPLIYLASFQFETEEPSWRVWQRDWINTHPEIWVDWQAQYPGRPIDPEANPFPINFYAFHYDDTDRIQINAQMAFLQFLVNGPDGMKHDYTGLGYYSAGHEMHHYALQSRGIPSRLHHCLFLQPRSGGRPALMDQLASELVSQGISSNYIYSHGRDWEYTLDPCGKLSAADRALVETYRQEL